MKNPYGNPHEADHFIQKKKEAINKKKEAIRKKKEQEQKAKKDAKRERAQKRKKVKEEYYQDLKERNIEVDASNKFKWKHHKNFKKAPLDPVDPEEGDNDAEFWKDDHIDDDWADENENSEEMSKELDKILKSEKAVNNSP